MQETVINRRVMIKGDRARIKRKSKGYRAMIPGGRGRVCMNEYVVKLLFIRKGN